MIEGDERSLGAGLTYRDVLEIVRIIDGSPRCEELHLTLGDVTLTIVKRSAGTETKTAQPGQRIVREGSPEEHSRTFEARALETERTERGRDMLSAEQSSRLEEEQDRAELQTGIPITSRLVGTFYRAPLPGALPFVEVGHVVKENDPVGIVEVMKLMNLIRAPRSGVIREICVGNETFVQYGDILMVLEPLVDGKPLAAVPVTGLSPSPS